jgi:hypothetical protein
MHIFSRDSRRISAAVRQRERHARTGFSGNGYPLWSSADDQTLRRTYPDYAAAKRELPHRTHEALKKRVQFLGIQKRIHSWTSADLSNLRRMYPAATRQELHATFPGLSFPAIMMAANQRHIWRKKRPLQKTGNTLLDAIRDRARSVGYTMPDLDKIAHTKRFYRGRAWRTCVRPPYNPLYRAVEALDGEMLPPMATRVPDRLIPRPPQPTDRARSIPQRKHWTAGEVSRLRKVYSWAPVETLLAVFPGKSFAQIKRMASRYGLRRRQPKPIGHPLFDYLRKKAHEEGYTMVGLDRLARSRTHFFSNPSRRRRMNCGALGRAAEALKVPVQLRWNCI